MHKNNVKLSIITINRNNAAGLRRTMESVLAQTYRDIEYIVIDGASTDESVDVIKELESTLQFTMSNFRWISESDSGIYNAMNKGIKMAHGEYILMLNSGDFLVDKHVVESIIPELDGTDIIQGNNIEEQEGFLYRNRGYGKSDIDLFDVLKGHFLHQASFCRIDLFDKYGYFDESYQMGADTKFFMNCLGRHNAIFKYVDVDVTNYDLFGISAKKNGQWHERRLAEDKRLRNELFSKRLQEHYENGEKKLRLYDKLHAHKMIWNIVMFLTYIITWTHGEETLGIKRELLDKR